MTQFTRVPCGLCLQIGFQICDEPCRNLHPIKVLLSRPSSVLAQYSAEVRFCIQRFDCLEQDCYVARLYYDSRLMLTRDRRRPPTRNQYDWPPACHCFVQLRENCARNVNFQRHWHHVGSSEQRRDLMCRKRLQKTNVGETLPPGLR